MPATCLLAPLVGSLGGSARRQPASGSVGAEWKCSWDRIEPRAKDEDLIEVASRRPAALDKQPAAEAAEGGEGKQTTKRTRRLLARFALWSSHSEMQQRLHNLGAPGSSSVHGQLAGEPLAPTRCARHSHRPPANDSHLAAYSICLAAPVATSAGHLVSENAPLELGEGIQPRRLWQSLVLPLVLACIIFLVALWTRQISLALTNDTILMLIILMGVFVVMSGVAFWLSCEQQLQQARQRIDEHVDEEAHQQRLCHCQHHHSNHNSHNNDINNDINNNNNNNHHHHHHRPESHQHCPHGQCRPASNKCCRLALLDCRPPDYHWALANSLPVSLVEGSPQQSPPSYAELAREYFGQLKAIDERGVKQ